MHPALPILLVGLLMVLAMTALWLWQQRHHDAGIVDVGWTAGIGLAAVLYAILLDGHPARRAGVGALAAAWSLRLALYIYHDRVRNHPEDRRYATLRSNWGDKAPTRFFLFFQAQGLLVVLFSLPIWIALRGTATLGLADLLGAAVLLTAIAGEATADRQLSRFRANPDHRGTTCRDGWWRYSRHPNYFFEWLHWWAYVAFAFQAPHAAYTLLGPAIMLFFLFKVTGIPATEAQAVKSRGDDYREYQRTTSVFIPWFPRRGNA